MTESFGSSNQGQSNQRLFDFDAADLFADDVFSSMNQMDQISVEPSLPVWEYNPVLDRESKTAVEANPFSRIISEKKSLINDGDQVAGTVVNVSAQGVTLELLNGNEILFPVSEFFDNVDFNPRDLFRLGQKMSLCGAVVTSIFNSELNRRTARSSLLQEMSWRMIREAKASGRPLLGKVVAIAQVGVFVDLRSVLGFIPKEKCESLYSKDALDSPQSLPVIRVRVKDLEARRKVFLRPAKPVRGSRQSQRGHLTSDYEEKRGYQSQEIANEVIGKMERRPCHELSAYQCSECTKWHVGNTLIAHAELQLVDVLPDLGLERSILLWGFDEQIARKTRGRGTASILDESPSYFDFIEYVLAQGARITKVSEGELDVSVEIHVHGSVWKADVSVSSVSTIHTIDLRAIGDIPIGKSATRFCEAWNKSMPIGPMDVDSQENSLNGNQVVLMQRIDGSDLFDWKSMVKTWAMCVNSMTKSLAAD